MAEAVMSKLTEQSGLRDKIYIDSAGTSGYHQGELADSRMRHFGQIRGYQLLSRARQLEASDFEKFDYILGMDDSNITNILLLDHKDKFKNKIFKMTDFCSTSQADFVPDPYYGGTGGFENVIDILEDSCASLLDKIKQEHKIWNNQLAFSSNFQTLRKY